jgi:uroporphyrinogen III methyltransferase / synthase
MSQVKKVEQSGVAGEKPLFGRCVMVTRPRNEAQGLCDQLAALGAEVIVQPAIGISAPPQWEPVDAALARLDQYDWLVFSSAQGVRYLIGRLQETGHDASRLKRIRLAAIGPGTAEELTQHGLCADLIPPQYRAEPLADALLAAAAPQARFLLARASRGRETLAERLRAAGGVVDQVVVYTSSDVTCPDVEAAAALAAGRIDWITVTSSAIARALAALFGDGLRRAKLASISPLTSGVLGELGYPSSAEATQYTMAGLVEAIVRASQATSHRLRESK